MIEKHLGRFVVDSRLIQKPTKIAVNQHQIVKLICLFKDFTTCRMHDYGKFTFYFRSFSADTVSCMPNGDGFGSCKNIQRLSKVQNVEQEKKMYNELGRFGESPSKTKVNNIFIEFKSFIRTMLVEAWLIWKFKNINLHEND